MTKAVQQWDQNSIQSLLLKNDKAVARALLQIYHRQTMGEKSSFSTQVANDAGFTAADAPALTRYAQKLRNSGSLSPAELALVRQRMLKYHRQLLEVILDRQLTQLTHSA